MDCVDESVCGDAMQTRLAEKFRRMELSQQDANTATLGNDTHESGGASSGHDAVDTLGDRLARSRARPRNPSIEMGQSVQRMGSVASVCASSAFPRSKKSVFGRQSATKHSRGTWILMEDEEPKAGLPPIEESDIVD